ncbi:zinc finger protein 181-like isoform X2 [Thrips palmi]|nr:zinc finger protein 181-like isoform X2 [Thrips palmi]
MVLPTTMNTVFGLTKVTLSECFLKNIPDSDSKVKLFKESFNDLKCTMIEDGNYCLEGSWEAVVRTEQMLQAILDKWMSKVPTKQQNAQIIEINSANLLLTQPIDHRDLEECMFKKSSKSTVSAECSEQADQDLDCSANQNQAHPLQETNISYLDDPSAENEVYMDIQLEHNYNHFKADLNNESMSNNGEPMVENEIYMDIKLSKTNNESFANPDLPVMLVVAKDDEPGVEVLQLNVNKPNGQISPTKEYLGEGTVPINQSEDLKLRRKKYEEKAPFKYFCNQCSFKTKRYSHMRNHSRFHERICTIYSCDQCDFSTIRASHLQRHVGTHKPEAFTCSECTYSTHSEIFFKRHQRLKHKAKQPNKPKTTDTYQCLQCDYMTTSEKIFNRHLTVHTKKKHGKMKQPCFKCKQCSYQTPSRSNFYRHLGGVHGDERPFMCPTCGLCFKRSDTLAQHQTTHVKSEESGRSAFQCEKCEKSYRSTGALEEHKLTHEEERRYLCEICGSSFKTRAVQRKHFIETHVHTKVHPCSTCSKTFTTKYLLKRHMKVHSLKHQDKITTIEANSSPQEISTNTIGSIDWCQSIVPAQQSSNDVQVFVVYQEPSQQDLSLQEGHLFQVSPSLVASQTLSASVLPVEFVISEGNSESENCGGETAVNEQQ